MEEKKHREYELAKNPGRKQSDITALKKKISSLESELQSKNDQLKIWDDIVEEGYIFHQNGAITDVNVALSRITGFASKFLLGLGLHDFFDELSFKKVINCIKENDLNPIEVRIINKAEKFIDVHAKCKTVKVGKRRSYLIVIQDIRELAKTRLELEDSERRHRMISSLLSDYIYTSASGLMNHLGLDG